MINEDQAMDIANAEFRNETKAAGVLPTLYGYSDHWIASLTYTEAHSGDRTTRRIRIGVDGSVRPA